jgi:hypothetical protein
VERTLLSAAFDVGLALDFDLACRYPKTNKNGRAIIDAAPPTKTTLFTVASANIHVPDR